MPGSSARAYPVPARMRTHPSGDGADFSSRGRILKRRTYLRSVEALRSLPVLVAAVALLGIPLRSRADVTVQQVEALCQPADQHAIRAINFAGSATATDGTNYPGITFHAQSGTVNTYSGHAFFVASEMYGASSPGKPFVSNVYNRSANDYLNGLNVQGTLSAGQPLPGGFGNGIKVSNHSYVADYGNATADENAIRRIDYTVNSEDVVLVASAVTGSTFANQNLVWSAAKCTFRPRR